MRYMNAQRVRHSADPGQNERAVVRAAGMAALVVAAIAVLYFVLLWVLAG